MMPSTSQSSLWNSGRIRCDFCDCFTNNDAELAEHISSDSHKTNRSEFIKYQKDEIDSSKKRVPLSLIETLDVLRLRKSDAVMKLAEKDFFSMTESAQAAMANEFSRRLVKALVLYESQYIPDPILRQKFLEPFQNVNIQEREEEEAEDEEVEVEEIEQEGSTDDIAKSDQISDLEYEDDDPGQAVHTRSYRQDDLTQPGPSNSHHSTKRVISEPTSNEQSSPTKRKGEPLPDPNSTYIPKLSVIIVKEEPKDD